jgi:NADH-quinone oxidoreductase subunit A
MMSILTPPVAFVILLVLAFLLSGAFNLLSARGRASEGKTKSYSCGEEAATNTARPNYSQFFPFAFFFTIMHVLILIIATVPRGVLVMPLVYLGAGVLALFILFRR